MSITISQPFKQSGQFPVDKGVRFLTLAEMTVVGNNPYTYYEDMIVRCIENHRNYIWREVTTQGETGGVMTQNFTYPQGASGDGIDYSNREFNFFPHKEEAETKIPDNVFFVSNETEFINAIEAVTSPVNKNIYITNSIAITGNSITVNGNSNIIDTGANDNTLSFGNSNIIFNRGTGRRLNFQKKVYFGLNISETSTLGGDADLFFLEMEGLSNININNTLTVVYENKSNLIENVASTASFTQRYWHNTNLTTQFELPNNFIFVSNNQEFAEALELDLILKIIVLTDSIVLDNQSITYRGNCTVLDTGRTISTIGLGINGEIEINAQSFNQRLDILCEISVSPITSHTSTIEGDGNVFVRSIRGSSNLILQGDIRFQYEYIDPLINLTNNSNGLVQQNFWHNTNKTSPTVGLTTDQLNTLNSLVGSEDMTMPIKENGVFVSSGMRRLDDGSLLAPTNFGIESGSMNFGDLVKLSEVSGFLAIKNFDSKNQFALIDTRFDDTFGTYRPRFFNLTKGEEDVVIQSSDINQITNTNLLMPITIPATGQVNSVDFKIFDECTNVRMKFTKDDSGVVFKYLPTKEAWITGQGGYNLSGTTIQNISLKDSQLRLTEGDNYTLEIIADQINMLGNPSNQPYLSVKAQQGEFTEIEYSLKPFPYLASEGTRMVTGNSRVSAALIGFDGVIVLDPEAKDGDLVRLNQLNNIGNNTLTFQTTNNQLFVYQKVDGTQLVDNEVVINKSLQVEFVKSGNTWRFYHKY